jgi:hypothetical protein
LLNRPIVKTTKQSDGYCGCIDIFGQCLICNSASKSDYSHLKAVARTQFAIGFDRGGIKSAGVTVSKNDASYQPVAWWFTKRRLGRELRNLYQAAEDLPPQFLALIRKLENKPDSSLQAKSEGCSLSRPQ